ncbi:MAG: metalloregulator ArsR/SmtB family transcription factor [Betaproteobacteria bacterium]|nr:metalloregulator ArsR/SmtB family transcription factor [Betaproteobacteria bacterium]
MDESGAAAMLGALGSTVRLRVYKSLLRAGARGMNVSDLQAELGMPPSTLAHHLGTLVGARLVGQERRGRELICTACYDEIRKLSNFLKAECCANTRREGSKP